MEVRARSAVGVAAVEKAIKWAAYLETHAARTYASISIASADAARTIIAKIRSGHLKEQFGSREIVRAQWSMANQHARKRAAQVAQPRAQLSFSVG